jgi:hypothetical protein
MDDPDDFKLSDQYYEQIDVAMFKVGDLVKFAGYHYSPDYVYIDGNDYNLGIVIDVKGRYVYAPLYRVFWFRKGFATDAVQDHLRLVVMKKHD